MEEKLHEDGALRAPYETYRESEVLGLDSVANLSLREMLALHERMNRTDLIMLEWVYAIAGTRRWRGPMQEEENQEGLFELIMTLEILYREYLGHADHDVSRKTFASSIASALDQGEDLDELCDSPEKVLKALDGRFDENETWGAEVHHIVYEGGE